MKKVFLRCLCLCVVLAVALGAGAYALADDEFEKVTAIDNEECAIAITGIDPDDMWGYTLKALLENKSADKTYMFSVETAFVNGVECDPFFASEVAPGKRANKDINFDLDTLEENGVDEPTDIEIIFRVYDSDDWTADDVAYETVHVYPKGEEEAQLFQRPAQDTDTILVDNDDISVIVTGYEHDSLWGYVVELFLVNKTDKTLMFSVDDASVNGFMMDPFYAHDLMAGKCCFDEMDWSDSDLEDNGIETVEDIEFSLRVYDSDDWMADDIFNDVLTLTP